MRHKGILHTGHMGEISIGMTSHDKSWAVCEVNHVQYDESPTAGQTIGITDVPQVQFSSSIERG